MPSKTLSALISRRYQIKQENIAVDQRLPGSPMSALGHKRTFRPFRPTSALPPKADIAPWAPFLHLSMPRMSTCCSMNRPRATCNSSAQLIALIALPPFSRETLKWYVSCRNCFRVNWETHVNSQHGFRYSSPAGEVCA
jgi:hypothetical protein